MQGIKIHNRMLAIMIEKGIFSDCPFTLIDVGCSGGIHSAWRSFEPFLRAYGIDPMIDEITKLQESEKNPDVRYYPAFVGLASDHPVVVKRQGGPPRRNSRFPRTSAMLALNLLKSQEFNHEQKRALNLWPKCRLVNSSNIVGVSEFVKINGINDVDFIKIDIDSYDLDVLISSKEIMNPFPILGFALEVNFEGSDSELDNTFHNMDRIMRANGYDLFALSVYQYSHKDMPGRFIYTAPGRTEYGPPSQGDAIYLRDMVSSSNSELANKILDEKLLKLAALFEMFGLPDCAAEVLNVFKERLSRILPLEPLLNALVPETIGGDLTYDEYISTFKNDTKKFFPSEKESPIGYLNDGMKGLAEEIETLKCSRSWRITAPLRYLSDVTRRPGRFVRQLLQRLKKKC